MRTLSPDLKARFFAIVIGLTYVAAVMLAMGLNQNAIASELDPRPELERLIDEYVAREIQVNNARLDCRLLNNTSCDERYVLLANREMLLADGQVERAYNAGRETLVRQSKSELQDFE